MACRNPSHLAPRHRPTATSPSRTPTTKRSEKYLFRAVRDTTATSRPRWRAWASRHTAATRRTMERTMWDNIMEAARRPCPRRARARAYLELAEDGMADQQRGPQTNGGRWELQHPVSTLMLTAARAEQERTVRWQTESRLITTTASSLLPLQTQTPPDTLRSRARARRTSAYCSRKPQRRRRRRRSSPSPVARRTSRPGQVPTGPTLLLTHAHLRPRPHLQVHLPPHAYPSQHKPQGLPTAHKQVHR